MVETLEWIKDRATKCSLFGGSSTVERKPWDRPSIKKWSSITPVELLHTLCATILQTPDISIAIPEDGLEIYHPVELAVSFTNPLDKALTGGKFTLRGGGFVQDATVDIQWVLEMTLLQKAAIVISWQGERSAVFFFWWYGCLLDLHCVWLKGIHTWLSGLN